MLWVPPVFPTLTESINLSRSPLPSKCSGEGELVKVAISFKMQWGEEARLIRHMVKHEVPDNTDHNLLRPLGM